ncbi:hypothetical protein HPB52_009934 [Rhipicephalus sanguineus]|uniref:Uncharacterized protein n=1 Tax=Rhipicephalus sanguineus TaxID=34632 RepID=A0A9D4T972_RHISA|nr:hypothetical protein HPB52_009934 [Rhipicephalus sanguineus]
MSCFRYMQRRARAKGLNAAPYFTLQREICEQSMVITSKPPEQLLGILQPELVTTEHGPLYLRLQTLDRLSVAFFPDDQLCEEALHILLILLRIIMQYSLLPRESAVKHEVILNVPGILKRLVMIACAKPYAIEFVYP